MGSESDRRSISEVWPPPRLSNCTCLVLSQAFRWSLVIPHLYGIYFLHHSQHGSTSCLSVSIVAFFACFLFHSTSMNHSSFAYPFVVRVAPSSLIVSSLSRSPSPRSLTSFHFPFISFTYTPFRPGPSHSCMSGSLGTRASSIFNPSQSFDHCPFVVISSAWRSVIGSRRWIGWAVDRFRTPRRLQLG